MPAHLCSSIILMTGDILMSGLWGCEGKRREPEGKMGRGGCEAAFRR